MARGELNNSGMQEGKFLENGLLGSPKGLDPKWTEMTEGVNAARRWIQSNLDPMMHKIRKHQVGDPSLPNKPFMKNLVMDVEAKLEEFLGDDDTYEVRAHSAVGTLLDQAGGVDFWVEIYNTKTQTVIANYKIDLTANGSKKFPGGIADKIYYYDTDKSDLLGPKAMYKEADYKDLVRSAVENLANRAMRYMEH